MRNKRFPKYPDDADYNTNSPSYYDDLARKQKLIQLLAEKIWEYEETLDLTLEQISNRLETYIEENDHLMTERLEQWDLNLEKFPESVELILQEWLSGGTLDHIINETIFNWKADKTYVDSELAQTMKEQSQADFVNIVKNLTSYTNMFFKKISQDYYQIFSHDGARHVTYGIQKDANDDMFKVYDGFVGSINRRIYSKNNAELIGSGWTLSSGTIHYTNVVGDTFTGKVKGSALKLRSYKDDRGGLFEVVIDDEITLNFSTYSETTGSTEDWIIEGLDPNKEHTIVATFKGDDPNNPPSTGEGTARGWMVLPAESSQTGTFTGYVVDNTLSSELLKPYSNKEYAFSVTKNGNTAWIPEHSNIGTAFSLGTTYIIIDGITIDVSTLSDGEILECKEVKLLQYLGVRIPEVEGDVATIRLTTQFDIDGVVNISGKWVTLQDVTINAGYPLMIPCTIPNAEIVTSFGNTMKNDKSDTDYFFNEEKDSCYSTAFVSSSQPNLITAGSVNYPLQTLQKGKETKDLTQALRFYQGSSFPKLYFTNFKHYDIKVGENFSWFSSLSIAFINDIYNYVKV